MTTIPSTTMQPTTRDQVQSYAEAVGDFNPVHFDAEFARAAGLPDTVVHGPLTAAQIIDVLVGHLGTEALLNADVRLRAPVFPGDQLSVESADYGVAVTKADGTLAATVVVITRGSDMDR